MTCTIYILAPVVVTKKVAQILNSSHFVVYISFYFGLIILVFFVQRKLTILEQKYPECANAPSNGDSVPADSNGVISKGGGATSFPSFDGKDLDGNDIKSSDFFKSNNVTVVNYWFSTCKPCVGELPELEALNKKLTEKGGQVVGINTFTIDGDRTAISEAKDILSKKGVTYKNIWFDSNSDAGKFTSGLFSYPTTYVVDKNGNIVGEPIVGAITEKNQATVAVYCGNRFLIIRPKFEEFILNSSEI